MPLEVAEEDSGDGQAAGLPERGKPIAALPESGIALYPLGEQGVSEDGVVLEIGDRRQRLDWRYTTPRQIMPVMQAGDYDGDGKDELAVILNVDSGTGVSVDELHMVEFHGVNGTPDEPFIDYMMQADDYREQLEEAHAFRVIERGGEWFGEVEIGGRITEVGLQDWLTSYEIAPEAIQATLGFGNLITFEADRGGITFAAAIGLVVDGIAEPQYIGSIAADVAYGQGMLTLGNYRFAPEL